MSEPLTNRDTADEGPADPPTCDACCWETVGLIDGVCPECTAALARNEPAAPHPTALPSALAGPPDDYAYSLQLMQGFRVVSQFGGTTWGRMPTAQEVEDDLIAMLTGFIVRTLGGNLPMLRGGRIAFAFGSSADLMATNSIDQLAAAEARAATLEAERDLWIERAEMVETGRDRAIANQERWREAAELEHERAATLTDRLAAVEAVIKVYRHNLYADTCPCRTCVALRALDAAQPDAPTTGEG